jgi:hypothetical protein
MIGAKPGNRIAIVGATDPALCAQLGLVAGLNGQAVVFDEDLDARRRIEAAAATAGTLIEFDQATPGALSANSDHFDVAVLMVPLAALDTRARAAAVDEAMRVIRPGGRIIVVDGAKRRGLFGLGSRPVRVAADELLALLAAAGGRAQRQLMDAEGVAFYETRK